MTATADAPSTGRSGFAALEVVRVERLCEDAVAVAFDLPPGLADRYAFAPGQHVAVRRVVDGVEHRRSYSVCAAAGDPLRIGVRRVPDGALSAWLVDAVRPGDRVEVAPPTGRFTLDPARGGRHVLVAAGAGVTPLMSMAASLLARSEARVTFVYANRRASTTMFLDELAGLKDRWPSRLDLVHVLSREPREVALLSGRLDGRRLEELLGALVPVAHVDGFWLCGPFAMVEEHRAALGRLGVPAERVHAELFHVDEPPPPLVRPAERAGAACRVTVDLDGRVSEVDAGPGATLLDAVRAVRPEVPFACRGGVCGTCRARLVSGRAPMRRSFALEPDEVAAGFVLTCQAVPESEHVHVDYDA